MASTAGMKEASLEQANSASPLRGEPRVSRQLGSLFDAPSEEDPSAMLAFISKLQADVRRLDKRVDNLGASTAYNVDVMQEFERYRPATSSVSHHHCDAEIEALRRAARERFADLEKHMDAVLRTNASLEDRLARAEKKLASSSGSEASYTSRAKLTPPRDKRQRRYADHDDVVTAMQQAYSRQAQLKQTRSRTGNSSVVAAESPPPEAWGYREVAQDRRHGGARSFSPARSMRARSRSPDRNQRMMPEERGTPSASVRSRSPGPYRRTMQVNDNRMPFPPAQPRQSNAGNSGLWHPIPNNWNAYFAEAKSFWDLADILREKIGCDKEISTDDIHGALRDVLGEQRYYEILDACGGASNYLALASRHLRIAKSPQYEEVVLFSEKHQPFHLHEDNQAYFARLAAIILPPQRLQPPHLQQPPRDSRPMPRFQPHGEPRPQFQRGAPSHLQSQPQNQNNQWGSRPMLQSSNWDPQPRNSFEGWGSRRSGQSNEWRNSSTVATDPLAPGWGDETEAKPQSQAKAQPQSPSVDGTAAAWADAPDVAQHKPQQIQQWIQRSEAESTGSIDVSAEAVVSVRDEPNAEAQIVTAPSQPQIEREVHSGGDANDTSGDGSRAEPAPEPQPEPLLEPEPKPLPQPHSEHELSTEFQAEPYVQSHEPELQSQDSDEAASGVVDESVAGSADQ